MVKIWYEYSFIGAKNLFKRKGRRLFPFVFNRNKDGIKKTGANAIFSPSQASVGCWHFAKVFPDASRLPERQRSSMATTELYQNSSGKRNLLGHPLPMGYELIRKNDCLQSSLFSTEDHREEKK